MLSCIPLLILSQCGLKPKTPVRLLVFKNIITRDKGRLKSQLDSTVCEGVTDLCKAKKRGKEKVP